MLGPQTRHRPRRELRDIWLQSQYARGHAMETSNTHFSRDLLLSQGMMVDLAA
jgi:hypothetical protein